ncbi:max dimerization protein 1 isoform X2 [Callorhinchus milii]|nr:max dimerization protein 1 isoform X1 [Callorhinchus milii]XP_042200501.1 max dimerization protein 1 isoform X2 [Callorhinchus milii]
MMMMMDAVSMTNIERLIEAAHYLERRDREAEHGYASLLPYKRQELPKSKSKSKGKKSPSNRSMHNEMEKNRRAHLRLCLERLKELVPLGPETAKHTTLSLLMRAKLHIKKLEESDRRAVHQIDQLQREQRHLKRQLELLGEGRIRMDSTSSTISSDRSDSDQEEIDVDVEGTDCMSGDVDWSNSSVSDFDEQISVKSSCSDEGYFSTSFKKVKLTPFPHSKTCTSL